MCVLAGEGFSVTNSITLVKPTSTISFMIPAFPQTPVLVFLLWWVESLSPGFAVRALYNQSEMNSSMTFQYHESCSHDLLHRFSSSSL